MDIGKSNDNFKDVKPKCFNYNKYEHIAKERQKRRQRNRVLETISSRHGTRDLFCKFSIQIYYSKLKE